MCVSLNKHLSTFLKKKKEKKNIKRKPKNTQPALEVRLKFCNAERFTPSKPTAMYVNSLTAV